MQRAPTFGKVFRRNKNILVQFCLNMPPEDFDPVGPWSEVKLAILREYAGPYSRIVSSKGFHHLYIDGFAGGGRHISRETDEIVAGSPLNALSTKPPFKEYHFVDLDPVRVEQLRGYAGTRPDVFIYEGDCNEVLPAQVFLRAKYDEYRRALCVLDPFNIGLSWELVQTAGKMGSIEIFLNFMVMDINMNVLLTKPDNAKSDQLKRMTRFWGDTSWREAAYEKDRQGRLFDEPGTVKVDDANGKIAEAYRRRLLEVAGFKHAPSPLPFRNSLGRTVYYLFFASPDPTANKIVQQIFDKYRNRKWS